MYKCFVMLILSAQLIWAQSYDLHGIVKDDFTNNPLPAANVLILELEIGTTTNSKGEFVFNNLNPGNYSIQITFIGYDKKIITLNLNKELSLEIQLTPKILNLDETIIKGKRAIIRETPIAFNNVNSEAINQSLGTRYLTEALDGLPGLHISTQGGGFADSRLNIRGFDQTNIAVMINGIPINNPENGEIYWSNWADLNDVVDYIQVQRGLSAAPYSVSSVGGLVNIVSNSAFGRNDFTKFTTQVGPENFYKSAISFSSQLAENINITGMVSRATWDGYADQTWADVTTYYFSLGFLFENHSLEFQLMGSPQKHGQRITPLSVEIWDKKGLRFNSDWGILHGKPLNIRDNEFNKPALTINHNWQINSNALLSNSFYLSHGTGGGTVPPWSDFNRNDDGLVDFDKVWQLNSENIDSAYSNNLALSNQALRFTIHEHDWTSFLSAVKLSFTNLTVNLGVDGKYYVADNYSTLSNLLGGDYFIGGGNVNLPINTKLYEGDKVDYFATSFARSLGAFIQGEFNSASLNAYLNLSASNTGYNRIDHFNYLLSDPKRETGWKDFNSFTIKAGTNVILNANNAVYLNAGIFSKAPLSMNVYSYSNELYSDVKNEQVISTELGYSFNSSPVSGNLNLFLTYWNDKAFNFNIFNPDNYETLFFNVYGAKALHRGIEGDGKVQLWDNLEIKAALSFSINEWLSDVNGFGHHESLPNIDVPFNANVANLYVGNAPMTNLTVQLIYKNELANNLKYHFAPTYLFKGRYYSNFNVTSRTSQADAGIQSWRIPDYYLVNLNTGLEWKTGWSFAKKVNFNLNIYNLFNRKYIIDAFDGLNHDEKSSSVWFGRERWMDATLSFEF